MPSGTPCGRPGWGKAPARLNSGISTRKPSAALRRAEPSEKARTVEGGHAGCLTASRGPPLRKSSVIPQHTAPPSRGRAPTSRWRHPTSRCAPPTSRWPFPTSSCSPPASSYGQPPSRWSPPTSCWPPYRVVRLSIEPLDAPPVRCRDPTARWRTPTGRARTLTPGPSPGSRPRKGSRVRARLTLGCTQLCQEAARSALLTIQVVNEPGDSLLAQRGSSPVLRISMPNSLDRKQKRNV